MIDLRTVSSSLLAACVVLPAQKASTEKKPKLSKAQQLVAELKSDDGWERAAARLVLLRGKATEPLAKALETAGDQRDDQLAKRILAVLDRLGMDAAEATDSVWDALDDLGDLLVGIGLDTVTQITPAGDTDPMQQIRGILTKVLGRGGGRRKSFMQTLNTNLRVLQGKFRMDPDATVEALHAGLKRNNPQDRDGYCQLLGQRGKASRTALQTLVRLLASATTRRDSQSHRFARNAAIAIQQIDPFSKEAAYAYGFLILHEPFRDLRLRAARELMMLGPHVAEAVPLLVKIGSKDTELLHMVINCLAMAGAKAKATIPRLQKLSKSDNEKTAARAKAALKRIRGTAKAKKRN